LQKVFSMYKLRPDVKIEDYRKWSREVDQVITASQPGVHHFEVYEIKGAGKGAPPYQIVEDIDVDSFEAWQKVLSNEAMKKVGKGWANYADESTLVVIYGEKVK
jgi:uncharacterized protein (TIGR02118 family)